MSSKKIACPLSSIFQQWTAQHQKRQVDAESHSSSSSLSYRILLQTSFSLKARVKAAEPVENPHLYKRAGLATPSEKAVRDIRASGETAWLLRLVELAAQQQHQRQEQNGLGGDASTTDTESIIYLTTKTQSDVYSVMQELPEDARGKVRVVDIDPFGLEEKENDTDDGKATIFAKNLRQLYQGLKKEVDRTSANGTHAILVWQSLTPLIVVHGFKKVLRLLCALPSCFQVWPVNLQVMTPEQHAQLEDASNAILHLYDGEMNLIRQGIRERGNVLRQKVPFQLKAIVSDGHEQRRYRIVKESEDEEGRNDDDDNDNGHRNSNKDENGSNGIVENKVGSIESSRSDGRSRGAHVRIEESDGGRNEKISFPSEKEVSAPSRPRIYLEDDDPEFDDFDEEDPDDDLDI
jgi:hypothetical protein